MSGWTSFDELINMTLTHNLKNWVIDILEIFDFLRGVACPAGEKNSLLFDVRYEYDVINLLNIFR